MIDGRAEQVTDDAELEPVATASGDKYPTGLWDFVVRDGAFGGRDAGGRVLVFGAPGHEAWGSERAITFSQTTWRGFR